MSNFRPRWHWDKPGCTCDPTIHGNRDHNWRCKVHGGWRTIDWTGIIAGVVVFAVIAIIIGGVVLIRTKAPCSVLDWMPVKDVPARCLTVGPQR